MEKDLENGEQNGDSAIVDSEAPVFDGDEDQDFASVEDEDPADDDLGENLADARDNRGRFTPGGRPGPGRGKTRSSTLPNANPDVGAGEPMSNVALIGLIDAAISRRGTKFWDELTKERPAVVAQLRGTLARLEDVAPGSTGGGREPVTILLPDAMMPSEAGRRIDSIMGPPDPATMDAATLAAEVIRLREELAAEKRRSNGLPPPPSDYRPVVPAQPGPSVECPTCRELVGIKRMIEPGQSCKYCGQSYLLAQRGLREPLPKEGDGLCHDVAAWTAGDVDSGWTSHDSIESALDGVRNGGGRPRRGSW